MEEKTLCTCCGEIITNNYYATINDEPICDDCVDEECGRCESCDELFYNSDLYGQDYDRCLCEYCMNEYYTHCDNCDDLISRENAYELDDSYYCSRCYHEKTHVIHSYSHKPQPLFSMVRASVFWVWSWKLTEAEKTLTTLRSCWTLQMMLKLASISSQTVALMMAWSWSHIP